MTVRIVGVGVYLSWCSGKRYFNANGYKYICACECSQSGKVGGHDTRGKEVAREGGGDDVR